MAGHLEHIRRAQESAGTLFLSLHELALSTPESKKDQRLLEVLAAFIHMRHDLASLALAMLQAEGDLAKGYFARLILLELLETVKKGRQQLVEIIPLMQAVLSDRATLDGLGRARNDLNLLWNTELSHRDKDRNKIAHRDRLPALKLTELLETISPEDAEALAIQYLDGARPVVVAVERFSVAFRAAAQSLAEEARGHS